MEGRRAVFLALIATGAGSAPAVSTPSLSQRLYQQVSRLHSGEVLLARE